MSTLAILTVTLVVALCLLNLLLTVGVIRRLRQHAELISNLAGGGPPADVMLPVGEQAGAFTTESEDGEPITGPPGSELLLGVFSPGCPACTEQFPAFLELARGVPGGRESVLAVVVGPREEYATQIGELRTVARVVVEAPDGAVSSALGVRGFPSFARIAADGTIMASGYQVAGLGEPAGV